MPEIYSMTAITSLLSNMLVMEPGKGSPSEEGYLLYKDQALLAWAPGKTRIHGRIRIYGKLRGQEEIKTHRKARVQGKARLQEPWVYRQKKKKIKRAGDWQVYIQVLGRTPHL